MKKQQTAGRFILLLGTATVLFCFDSKPPVTDYGLFFFTTEELSPDPIRYESTIPQFLMESTIPQFLMETPEDPPALPKRKPRYSEPASKQKVLPKQNRSDPKQIVIGALPLLFDEQEGSSSDVTDLFGGGPVNVDVRSDWMTKYLFSNRTLPSLRMRILEDPLTGEYRISGGAVALPDSGLEAGYETESEAEGYKATLQWKKSF